MYGRYGRDGRCGRVRARYVRGIYQVTGRRQARFALSLLLLRRSAEIHEDHEMVIATVIAFDDTRYRGTFALFALNDIPLENT